MPLAGVLGWPVSHSRSPAMHEAAYAEAGLAGWRYQRLPVPPELFAETVAALEGAGFAGANVTIPHKEAALAAATDASAAAQAIGAANTLTFADGRIAAENTDAPGLLDALPVPPAGRTALVLGAGGSARAAVWALASAGARDVAVWNRTPERAARLCADLGGRPVAVPEPADILVNCTAAGLGAGEDPFASLPLASQGLGAYAVVADLVYGDRPSALLAAARAAGAATVDGLEILVRQGARSFEIWTGRPAPLEAMRAACAAPLGGADPSLPSG
ncbi:MAG: shikimate dehydrogenase [Solirubrobacteraceae bacterium]